MIGASQLPRGVPELALLAHYSHPATAAAAAAAFIFCRIKKCLLNT